MEVELFSNVMSEEDTVEVDADYDNLGDEGERCGICMDIVIDRGVLDCCQHWFCFVCIDNWATITNLCPLCQNEFQLITCVPVYDTIGSSNIDEDSDFRDDDWSVAGKNNNLSFPSYYIDENAVTCLDGDRCKIRSGSVTYEETLALDTSIACDSCDIWYHAFCVGFDPEGTGVDSWLCPRCLGNEADQNSDLKELYYPAKNDDQHRLIDTSSGKVSICVADSGETAMVVSRIDGEDVVDEPIMNCLPNQELIGHFKVEQSVSGSDIYSSEMKKPPDQGPESKVPSVKFGETVIKCEPDDGESRLPLNTGLSFASTLPDDNTNNLPGGDECVHDASIDESLEDVKADVAQKAGAKRKRLGKSFRRNSDKEPREGSVVGVSSTKKVKAERRTKNTLIGQADVCEDVKVNSKMIGSSADDLGRNVTVKNQPIDIMSIVQGKKISTAKRQKEADKCKKADKNAAGLRVKKIMRRPTEEKESDSVVEKLRKEIRDAVRNNPSSDIGKSILDPNLLSAFRAAVAGSAAESTKKAPSAIVKAKKLMLQKGKARENLTKKIYATSNGKRRRAWDRDCEIEFWKHRCLTTAKPEKVETLRSVLNLLKRGQGIKIVEQNTEEAKAPILSRLYLADTSLFPRKDDIQPLSVLKAAACSIKNSGEKHVEACTDDCAVKPSDLNEDLVRSNTGSADDKKSLCSSSKSEAASGKFSSRGHPDKASPQKKMNGQTGDIKVDKRKWALEVLARKSASDGTGSMHQKQENTAFKGNYPLLAELPTDMRPKLAPTRQNKIPLSVRQAQLYRLTEHFLKMTNLPIMRRTAETELAVADAINIEKQVADRSNSKVVYLNLCSQEVRNRASSNGSSTLAVSTPSPLLVATIGDSELTPSNPVQVPSKSYQSSPPSLNSEAEAALRAAGLFSDSPPSSPLSKVDYLKGDGNLPGEAKNEEIESIFEMDCHPDLDIYGDFEYDLDEEDYIGAAAINSSKVQAEDGESKVKVVFSSLSSVKSDNAPEANEQDLPKTDVLSSTPSLLGSSSEVGNGNSPMEDKVDLVPLPGNTSLDSEVEELSIAECEALYGPDNELTNKSPNMVQARDVALPSANNLDIRNSDKNTVTTDSLNCDVVGEKSSSALDHKGKVDEQKNSNRKVDKKSEHGETVLKKVEAYIKEHIRPLCKSGVITVDQYRWAVGRTTEKVMKYHTKSKNANFLIKEGEKVKKLAEQYVDTAKHKEIK